MTQNRRKRGANTAQMRRNYLKYHKAKSFWRSIQFTEIQYIQKLDFFFNEYWIYKYGNKHATIAE